MACSKAVAILFGSTLVAANDPRLCVSPTGTYTAKVNLYASELGQYQFEECGDLLNPTIGMELGTTYTFVQKDRTNYYHPLGFAYSPFGDEEIKLEVMPELSRNKDHECKKTATCPAAMHFLEGRYLGNYSNIPEIMPVTTNELGTGLEEYGPIFSRSIHEWAGAGTFSIKFRFDDESHGTDLFYFCHVHEFMVGRIKLMKNGEVLRPLDSPSLGYTEPALSDFDKECGTSGLSDFQLPNPVCPARFVCGAEEGDEVLQSYSRCTDAMNCAMLAGMTTGVQAKSPDALFIHQMIPHHANAVNMAKALLKTKALKCDDLADDENQACVLEGILYEIVNNQNLQIQMMYDYLATLSFPAQDNCVVKIETLEEIPKSGSVRFDMAGIVLFPLLGLISIIF